MEIKGINYNRAATTLFDWQNKWLMLNQKERYGRPRYYYAAVVAGLFAIASAFFTWRLKRLSDEKSRQFNHEENVYQELKNLYIKAYELLENALKKPSTLDAKEMSEKFSRLSAEINLCASDEVISLYKTVAENHAEWTYHYFKAYSDEFNDHRFTMMQSSVSTLNFEESEKESYKKLYGSFQALVSQMKNEIRLKRLPA